MIARIIDAGIVLQEICPHGEWDIKNNDYDTLIWSENNSVSKPTKEEYTNKLAELEALEPMRLLRIERNQKLAETDWITLKAYSQKQDVSEDWANYMQALRDLPATADPQLDSKGNLINVTWPEVPE